MTEDVIQTEEELLSRIENGDLDVEEAEVDLRILSENEEALEMAWNGDASRFTDQQYKRSCLIVMGDTKDKMSLPVRDPGGALNCAGVSAAASRLGQVQAPPEQKKAAAKKLVALMRKCGQEPSAALLAMAGSSTSGASKSSSSGFAKSSSNGSQKNMAERFVDWLESGMSLFGDSSVPTSEGVDFSEIPEETATLYQMPLTLSEPIELGSNRFKKPLFPVGRKVHYERNGKKKILDFSKEKLQQLLANFKAKAFDVVPLLDRHTDSIDAYLGTMVDAELDDKWFYGIFETNERGTQRIKECPDLPTSVGYYEEYTRSGDQKRFGPTLQHVATVFKPQVSGLGSWSAVELNAGEAAEVVDLREAEFTAPATRKESGPVTQTVKTDETREEVEMETTDETQPVTLAELNALREELEAERKKREATELAANTSAKMLREQGINQMLNGFASFEKDGQQFARPPAKLDAARTILSALEGSGNDPIELSASGAKPKDDDLGKALEELFTPWEAIPLGETGSAEATPVVGDSEEALNARAQALMQEKSLDYADALMMAAEEVTNNG